MKQTQVHVEIYASIVQAFVKIAKAKTATSAKHSSIVDIRSDRNSNGGNSSTSDFESDAQSESEIRR